MAGQYGGGNNFPKKEWTMWDVQQLELRGVPWDSNNPKEYPKAFVRVTPGMNLVWVIFLNRPGEKGSALRLTFPYMDFRVIGKFFEKLEKRAGAGKYTYTLRSNFGPGGYSETPSVVGKMTIGKNTEGVMYLGFNNGPNKPPSIFEFKDSYMAELSDEAGERVDISELSPIKAQSWIEQMSALITTWSVIYSKEPPAKDPKPGYGGGASKSTSSTFDDDLPY